MEPESEPVSKRLRFSTTRAKEFEKRETEKEASSSKGTDESEPVVEEGEGEEEDEEEDDDDDEGVEEQMKEFFSEMDMDISRQKRNLLTDGLRAPRRKSVLPSHLYSVMGCANLRLARGDPAGAIELCLEVIRQAPHSPEPYLTLSTIYEEMGDTQKLLQILVISAHLKRNDIELWAKAGQLAEELNNHALAARCYHQASKLDPGNLTYLWKKASMYQLLNEAGKALTTYQQLMQMLPPTNSHDILEISKELAQLYYHHCNDPLHAIDVLHTAVHTHMSSADDEAIHLLVELYMSSKNYHSAHELILTYYNMIPDLVTTPAQSHDHVAMPTGDKGPSFQQMLSSAIRVSLSGETEEGVLDDGNSSEMRGEAGSLETLDLQVPDELPVDMRVKLAICLIHRALPLPHSLLSPITSHPEEYGDLFIDLAEAYAETGSPSQALPLLATLVHTPPYNQAAVWLKHAECLHTLQDIEGAAMSYSQVLNLAPHHTDTRLALATIYVQLGRVEDALALLESEQYEHLSVAMETTEECANEQDTGVIRLPEQTDYTLEGLRVLLHRYTVLLKSGRVSGYVSDGVSLLNMLFGDIVHRKDLRFIMHLSAKTLLDKIGTKTSSSMTDTLLSLPEWWKLFLTTCKGLLKMGHEYHKQLLHLVLCAATLKTFEDPSLELGYVLFASSVCCMLKEFELTFSFIKMVCIKFNHPMLWNLLNSLPLTKGYQKFLLRLCFKYPTNITLLRIHANYSLATSNYKFALCLYEQSNRCLPPNYLTYLCMGCVYFNMATQKGALSRNQLVLQGMGFFYKYLRLRGKCQESMYNLGRGFQQIGVVHVACHFYRQALALEPENNDPKWQLAGDLRPEAAFNLSQLYRASGNRQLALQVLRRYCRI